MTVRLLKLKHHNPPHHTHHHHHHHSSHPPPASHTPLPAPHTPHTTPGQAKHAGGECHCLKGDGVSALLCDDESVCGVRWKENVDVQLECGERFILKEVVVRVPERSRCPVRSGIVFVSNATISSEETARYNDLTLEGFKELQNHPKPGSPVCYFHLSQGFRQIAVPVQSSPTGKFILVKFLKSRISSRSGAASDSSNDDETVNNQMEIEFMGFYGEIIPGLPHEPEIDISSEESEETATPLPVDDEPTNALSESEDEDDIPVVHTPQITPSTSNSSIHKPPLSPRSPLLNLREKIANCTPSLSIKIPMKKLKLSNKHSSEDSEMDKSKSKSFAHPIDDFADNALSSAPSSQGNSPTY